MLKNKKVIHGKVYVIQQRVTRYSMDEGTKYEFSAPLKKTVKYCTYISWDFVSFHYVLYI